MNGFRLLLVVLLLAVVLYTIPVLANDGLLALFPTFFGDMAKMGWPGQFNLDFFGFLLLPQLLLQIKIAQRNTCQDGRDQQVDSRTPPIETASVSRQAEILSRKAAKHGHQQNQ